MGRRRRAFVTWPAAIGLGVGLALGATACGESPSRPSSVSPPATPVPTPTPAPPTPAPPPSPTLGATRFVAFGDSLTAGFTAVSATALVPSPPQAYPFKLEAMLRDRYYDQGDAIVVVNEGVNGEWAQDGQFRIVRVLADWRPDALLLMQGTNDLSAIGDAGAVLALEGLENTLRDARARGAVVFLATLPPQVPGSRLGSAAGDLLDEFNAAVRRLAARQNVPLVDVHAAFRGDLSLISADGLHPTEAGYQRIAEAFFEAIRSRFEAPPRSQ